MSYKITENGHAISNGWIDETAAYERMHELEREYCFNNNEDERNGAQTAKFKVVEE